MIMGLITSCRRRMASEAGVSVLELAITMGLMAIVGTVVVGTLSTSSRAAGQIDDQTRGLADLNIVTERISRDLRGARGVDDGATASQLSIWIDNDADYRREGEEIVTWRIQCRAGLDCTGADAQYDVLRERDGAQQVVGQSLVSGVVFTYVLNGVALTDAAAFDTADAVRVSMEYDALVGAYARSNRVDFETRLRNVE